MRMAMRSAESARGRTSPNPWVGAVLATGDHLFTGVTQPDGGPHAETVALRAATAGGQPTKDATLYVTLEPCAHTGKNPPCVPMIVEAGVRRVVVGLVDPDPRVSGAGIAQMKSAGIEVSEGVLEAEIARQLEPYLVHRKTGRPFVILKLATTLDGRIAAPDGTSKWITGERARIDVHRMRARCDAIIVGAATVSSDDPSLTVRIDEQEQWRQPRRVVLGDIPRGARVEPALSWKSDIEGLLDYLGELGDVQVMVEGGSRVAHAFHHQRLVDRYVLYVAPALMGGDDGVPVMSGPGAASMTGLWRGELLEVTRLGEDVKFVIDGRNE